MRERKYQIDTPENRAFLASEVSELLRFCRRFPAPTGSSYWLGMSGEPVKEQIRGTWITARMLHGYVLGGFLGFEGCDELVDAALRGLLGELHDEEFGGWFYGVDAQGAPAGEPAGVKECYQQAFAILAGTSALLAGRPRAEELLAKAKAEYDVHFWDEKEGMARDSWNRDFTVCDPYRGLNANMHSTEAFLAAADVCGEEEYRVRAGRIIDRVIGWAEANDWRIPEHYSEDWVPDPECNRDRPADGFRPYGSTPGHGMEWARLIVQWALSMFLTDPGAADPYIEAAQALYGRAREGWFADGKPGFVYTCGWDGKPVVHDRFHWVLAEAINTSAVLYRVTMDPRYAEDYAEYLEYLDKYMIDHERGSWFHQLDRDNRPVDGVWSGKMDLYHALQAMIIPYYDPSLSIALGVKRKAAL
ncbi:MAG: AGE family epimerase/isomerase [Lachnospiraceae bacterium]|nr:AGE family epimerase/isomerase [Lachnospiraceae bacterium]